VTMRVRMTPAKSASKKARAAMLSGAIHPTKKPDLDNVIKILDALNGVAFTDDALIVSITACKVYADTSGLDVTIAPVPPPLALAVAA
jgi:Holliday junction resolvase RusA-like endonuclease